MSDYIQKIQAFAKERSLPLVENYKEAKMAVVGTAKIPMQERVLYLKIHRHGIPFYLLFFDSLGNSTSNDSLYCSLLTEAKAPLRNAKIIRRDWFDALSFKKRQKTGNDKIDKAISIFGDSVPQINIHWDAVQSYLSMNTVLGPMQVETIEKADKLIPDLEGKSIVSIKIFEWKVETEDLSVLINDGVALLNELKK